MADPRVVRVQSVYSQASDPGPEMDAQDVRDLHISILVRGAVREEVSKAISDHLPSAEEREYLRLAVRRAARREKLQQAIIEKSLAGLIWAAVIFIGIVFYEYLQNHGWKP
jgi:hypothetical protein